MQPQISLRNLIFSVFLNAFLMIPFILVWGFIFVLVFLGISGILSGLFLIVTALTPLRISFLPAALYQYSLALWAYALFFIGTGGLFLTFMSVLTPHFLQLNKRYYYWSQSFIKGELYED